MPIDFFSRKPNTGSPSAAEAADVPPVREIAYNPAPVATLMGERHSMRLLLDRVKGSVQAGRYDEVKIGLDQFRVQLAQHIRREIEDLHAYLTAKIHSEDRLPTLKDMHTGTLRTERALEGFLKHYGSYPVNERNAAIFHKEVERVADEFDKWTRQEEGQVYSLYSSPESYLRMV